MIHRLLSIGLRHRETLSIVAIAIAFLGLVGWHIRRDFVKHEARLHALQASGLLPQSTPDSQTAPNRTVEAAIRQAIAQNLIPKGDNDCLTGRYRYQLERYGIRVDCRAETEPEWQGYGIVPPPSEAALVPPSPAAQTRLIPTPTAQ